MRRVVSALMIVLLGSTLWAQSPPADDTAKLRQELEQLKKSVAALEQKLAAQPATTTPATENKDTTTVPELKADVKEINERVRETERHNALDRLQWSGDYRFQAHTIRASVPAHFDGMKLQNMVVKTMFLATPQAQGGLGMQLTPAALGSFTPQQFTDFVNGQVQNNYSAYQFFTSNLTFAQLKAGMAQFPAQMQQGLMALAMPGTFVDKYNANNDILYTNRLRLRFDSQVSENVSFGARLSMYKVFGDSTGVQVFNGQANTLNLDGTTAAVPTGDMIRVERAFFSWNKIGGSKFYLSIGRRPSTEGPPMNFRQDEPRGGTPSGSLIDYQFDGITFGYNLSDKMTWRACYGVGYSSGFGNGNLLKTPADRLKDVHFLGANLDLYNSDKTFIQATIARAFNVTDGFNGQVVLPNNPLTGDVVPAPVIMRFTPSTNLGNINLYGFNAQRSLSAFDIYGSMNLVSTRPDKGVTTPFGGLMSDPFEDPQNHDGNMVLVGLRFKVPQNDGKTKIGFEFNHGSKYWFNFAQAEDDIIAPKTSTRGEVYETYLTHAISDHFIFKADFERYNYTWSGSGWHLGAPKRLTSLPVLGFPTYDVANMFTIGLTARF